MTIETRMKISQIFDELFRNHLDPSLRTRNWEIRELDFASKNTTPTPPLP